MINTVFSHYLSKSPINKMVFPYYILLSSLFAYCCWILYLEINPKLRNIWLRQDANSKIVFAPINIYNLMIYSVTHITFWYPWNWDMNCFIWMAFGGLIGYQFT